MALTKAWLKEILSKAGTPAENAAEAIESILDGHITSINALREEIATYKADAEKLPSVQKELDTLKANGDDGYDHTYDVVSSISVSADGSILTIVLADGTVITLPCA